MESDAGLSSYSLCDPGPVNLVFIIGKTVILPVVVVKIQYSDCEVLEW